MNTIIRGNEAATGGGGAYFNGSILLDGTDDGGTESASIYLTARMQNVLVSCNKAWSPAIPGGGGGGVKVDIFAAGYLSNCTFAGNHTGQWGGALHAESTSIYNSVFWNDTADLAGPEIWWKDTSTMDIGHSILAGGCPALDPPNPLWCINAEGLSTADPQFLDPVGPDPNVCGDEDYRLDRDDASPAIDSGDNTKVVADLADLDNNGDTGELTPRDLDFRLRFVDDPQIDPDGTAIVDMGAYESVRCEADGDCTDPSLCFGNASCVSTWCDIGFLSDCNGNHKLDLCDINDGAKDCNSDGLPDECQYDEFECIDTVLRSSIYACNDSLPRVVSTTLELTFGCRVPYFSPGPCTVVEVRELLPGGVLSWTNLASNFNCSLDGTNKIVTIRDNGNHLDNQKWYAVKKASGAWPDVADFRRDYVVVRGDADNSKITNFFDLNVIFGNLGEADGLTDRTDIDGSGVVAMFDIDLAFGNVGSFDPGKPSGHPAGCTP